MPLTFSHFICHKWIIFNVILHPKQLQGILWDHRLLITILFKLINPYLIIIRHCHSSSYYKYTTIKMKIFLLRIFNKLFVHNSCHVLCLLDVCSDLWGLDKENLSLVPTSAKKSFRFVSFYKELEITLQTSTNLPHLLQNCK